MKLPAAALLLFGVSAITSCDEEAAPKNGLSEPLTAQELARILQVRTWKIEVSKIPDNAELLQVVVVDQDGKIIHRGGSIGIGRFPEENKPLEMLIGIQMKDKDAGIFIQYDASGSNARFNLTDPFNEKGSKAADGGFSWTPFNESQWDGRGFFRLLSGSPVVGTGSSTRVGTSRIITLRYCSEEEASKPDGE